MPRNELRTSGLLQAAIIALGIAFFLRGDAPVKVWPHVVGAYGFLAATAPWLMGGLGRNDFSMQLSLLFGIFFALPVAVAAWWLASSPYRYISLGCWVLVGLWGLHFLASVGNAVRGQGESS